MKPVVVNPKITFEQLVRELTEVPETEKANILEQLIARLQRKKNVLKDQNASIFSDLAQLSVEELVGICSPPRICPFLPPDGPTGPECRDPLNRAHSGFNDPSSKPVNPPIAGYLHGQALLRRSSL